MLKRLLKRPSLNLLAWLLLAAFYISICLNIAFFKQVLQALPLDSLHNVLVFLSMPVVAFSVINIVLTLRTYPKRILFQTMMAQARCSIAS